MRTWLYRTFFEGRSLRERVRTLERQLEASRERNASPQSARTQAPTYSDLQLSYPDYVGRLFDELSEDEAAEAAVGGDYRFMGEHLVGLLRELGLKAGDYLIDVGCGSGRVAFALSQTELANDVRYLGIDVAEELLRYAEKKCARPEWRFEHVDEVAIPEEDDRADLVCFFSVFTHTAYEESYLYLKEAKRVSKRGATIVFTFFDFVEPTHWVTFEQNVAALRARTARIPNVFLSRDAIRLWAEKLDLKLEYLGSPDGGQSRCVLRNPG